VNAVHSSIVVDDRLAPDILIFRFTRWPSLREQKALLTSLVATGKFGATTTAVLDITALTELPDPDRLAGGLAQAASNNSILNRVACVVESQEQARFVDTLRMMAPQPAKVGLFFSEADALDWLRQSD
jgi:hypothetical protein